MLTIVVLSQNVVRRRTDMTQSDRVIVLDFVARRFIAVIGTATKEGLHDDGVINKSNNSYCRRQQQNTELLACCPFRFAPSRQKVRCRHTKDTKEALFIA